MAIRLTGRTFRQLNLSKTRSGTKFDMTFNNSAATANGLQGERRWRVAVKICRAAWRRDFEGRRVVAD